MLRNFKAIILGAPGSGKGTISSRIIRKFDLKHIASGDLLRSHVGGKSEAMECMNRGKLVSDSVVVNLVMEEIGKYDSWLLDGFPRTLDQAKVLESRVKVDAALNLVVPYDVIVERIRSRWIHAPSGRVYNTAFNPPKVPGRDDVTGEPLTQRQDDTPVSVRRRLDVYTETIAPLLEFYADKGVLQQFSGTTSDEIWPMVFKYLVQATSSSKQEIIS